MSRLLVQRVRNCISVVNELNKFVCDILAQRILAGLSKLKPQVLSSLTIVSEQFLISRGIS